MKLNKQQYGKESVMRFLANVELFGLRPELAGVLSLIDEVYQAVIGEGVVFTSGTERTSNHKRGSIHYSGGAIDIRTRREKSFDQLPADVKARLRDDLVSRLTREFDVVLEPDHIHLEFQPKGVY
jgi:hypothetical protein